MPFNGNGIFNRIYSWVTDATNGIKIRADRMDTDTNDIASGLTDCVTRDGQSPALADLPMGGFKHTGVANATSSDQYPSVLQIQRGKFIFVVAGGTADALTGVFNPPNVSFTDGMTFRVRALLKNLTTTPTFTLDSLAAHVITKFGGAALQVGDIAGPLHELLLAYNAANTRWELLNPAYGLVNFPKPQAGVNITNGGAAVQVGAGSKGTWQFYYDFGGGNAFNEFVNHSQFLAPAVYGVVQGGAPGVRTYDSSGGNLTLAISGAPGNIVGLNIVQIL